MELKAIKEYKNPEYPTTEESKNRILIMMVRSGKISLGMAIMCLLCNCSFASFEQSIERYAGFNPVEINLIEIQPIGPDVYAVISAVFFLGIIVAVLCTMFFTIKIFKQYKKCEDIEEKERLRKMRNNTLFKGGIAIVICTLLIMILNIIETLIHTTYFL